MVVRVQPGQKHDTLPKKKRTKQNKTKTLKAKGLRAWLKW
jgi:hypothetical protein